MVKTPVRAVLDSNILISAIVFGGNPKRIIELIQENDVIAITSRILISELFDVLVKKFHFTSEKLYLAEELIRENFLIVSPSETLNIVRDKDDNRVLEAAVEGKCQYIITGDKDLLDLKSYHQITILTPGDFVKSLETK